MSSLIFDGKTFASAKELELKNEVDRLHALGRTIRVTSLTFREDAGSVLYTKLKAAAAHRIGILYEPVDCSLQDDPGELIQTIRELSFNASVTGVMIQKPAKSVWEEFGDKRATVNFEKWWESLTTAIDPQKDVDCLTRSNLDRIYATRQHNASLILPATVKAVLMILQQAKHDLDATDEVWQEKSICVVGKSDIVGRPLTHLLRVLGHTVVNVGKAEFETTKLSDFPIIISAAGQPELITGAHIQRGAVVIDVGAPTGDVKRFEVEPMAGFLTPVPGGVGPVTVISLMGNILDIANR